MPELIPWGHVRVLQRGIQRHGGPRRAIIGQRVQGTLRTLGGDPLLSADIGAVENGAPRTNELGHVGGVVGPGAVGPGCTCRDAPAVGLTSDARL